MNKRTLTKEEKEILYSDFKDDSIDLEFDRETIEKYSKLKFQTKKDIDERGKKAFDVKLY